MRKHFLSILLCAALTFSLGACGNSNTDDKHKENGKEASQPSIINLVDYKDFSSILTGEYAVTDAKVESYFNNVIFSAGLGLKEVKDRDVVKAGDIVLTDYTGYLNGTAFSGGSTIAADGTSNPAWIDVTNNCGIDTETGELSGYFIDGFTDGLVGAKVGQKTSSEVTFPENYGNTELAGKLTTFEFNVKGIYEKVTTETITDAMVAETFAKRFEVSTVSEFMKVVEAELAYNLIMNYVIENSTFDIPEDYLNLRLEEYQNLFTELYCGSYDLETYLAYYYGTTLDAMKAQWASSLQTQIKAELVFEAIVEDAELKVDKKGLEEYVATIKSTIGTTGGNDFFSKDENVYKALGAGNVKIGKAYYLNQEAVREYVIENYK